MANEWGGGRRQGRAVDLAAREHGESGEDLEESGDHIRREPGFKQSEKGRGIKGQSSGGGEDDIGSELLKAIAVGEMDAGGGDAWRFEEKGLDLSELDPVAAELDLGIDAAEELEVAVGVKANEVACAVKAKAGAEDKARRGESGLVEVAAGESL